MYIAILGFGAKAPSDNLLLAEAASKLLVEQAFGIAVGNVSGTFLAALETAARCEGDGLAIVTQSMDISALPKSTKTKVVDEDDKHAEIARLTSAGLIIGGQRYPQAIWAASQAWQAGCRNSRNGWCRRRRTVGIKGFLF